MTLAAVVLWACSSDVAPNDPQESQPTIAESRRTPREKKEDPCAKYPPPFEATYLPNGFRDKLRKGAGLFKGTDDYPTKGLLGHYLGPSEVSHVNFSTDPGPLPYEPSVTKPLIVLGDRGNIGKIEGGWSVEFSYRNCDFEMDAYGLTRDETTRTAKGLRARRR